MPSRLKTEAHLEIEAKYDVADEQSLPDLVGVAGVAAAVAEAEVVLTATYFDTAGHALSVAGATLRSRSGGADDGWHLKLSVADGERLELHRPLGRSQHPPAALTSLVRALAGSQDVGAVATLTTRRTVHRLLDDEGRALAEVADDTVTGERLDAEVPAVSWREVEIELLDGDRELLAALDSAMRAGGVAPAGSSSKVGRVLQAPAAPPAPGRPVSRKAPLGQVLDGGLRHAARAVLTADPLLRVDRAAAAHRMRAAVRRLRAALAVQRQVAPEQPSQSLRSELVWLDAAVARLDDIDAAHPRIRAALATQPKELVLGPVVRRTDRELAAARKAAVAAVGEVLASQRYLRVLQAVRELATDGGGATVGGRAREVLPGLADRAARRAQRRLGQLHRAQSDGERRWQLVGARRAVDRARYAELLAAGRVTGPHSISTVLDEAADVLTELDRGVQTQAALRELGVQAYLAGESAFTFGRLYGLEDLRAAELTRRVNALRRDLKRARSG